MNLIKCLWEENKWTVVGIVASIIVIISSIISYDIFSVILGGILLSLNLDSAYQTSQDRKIKELREDLNVAVKMINYLTNKKGK